MNAGVAPPDPPENAHQQAAVQWHLTLNDPQLSAGQYQAWQDWLKASPEHARAWARVETVQQRLRGVPPDQASPALSKTGLQRRHGLKLLGLLAVGATVMAGYRTSPCSADLATCPGERRLVTLSDGSRLELNTDTWVDTRFNGREREIHLRRGEIFVTTVAAYPPGRPFSVLTPHGRVQAFDTRFNVRLHDGLSTVAVQSRAAEVRLHDGSQRVRRVEQGQALTFDSERMGALYRFDQQELAWIKGGLVVADWRLTDLIQELARYRPGYLGCAAEVADLRVSGTFRLDDIDAVLAGLATSLPVRIRRFSPWWIRVEA